MLWFVVLLSFCGQRELADDLRAKVVEELFKRREDIQWFIEGDFDAYVTRIQQPYVRGGEPELLMASHVLKKLISVFIKDKSTGELTNIATYGEEYKSEERPINVLFHGELKCIEWVTSLKLLSM